MADTRNGGSKPKKNGRTSGPSSKQIATTAGVAVGIGSAAVVAALLYANWARKPEEPAPVYPDLAPQSD